eukprot:s2001_g20.t1
MVDCRKYSPKEIGESNQTRNHQHYAHILDLYTVRSSEHTQQCEFVAMEAVDMVELSPVPEAAVEELALMVLLVLADCTDGIDLAAVDTKIFGVKLVFAVCQVDLFSSVYFSQ